MPLKKVTSLEVLKRVASSQEVKRAASSLSQTIAVSLPYNAHLFAILAPLLAFIQLRLRRVAKGYTIASAFSDWGLWIGSTFVSTIFSTIILHSLTTLWKIQVGGALQGVITCATWCAPAALLHHFRISKRPSFIPAVVLSCLFYIYKFSYLGQPENTGHREENIVGANPLTKKFLELYQEYFSLKVVNVTGQTLDPHRPRVMGYHPHGMVPYTAIFLCRLRAFQEQFPGLQAHALAHMAMHTVPAMRDIVQSYGAREASAINFRHLLRDDKTVLLVPGGVAEVAFAKPGNDLVLVTKHKGFVREALTNGASLLPCLCLGEHEIFGQLSGGLLGKIQKLSHKALGFPLPFLPLDKIGSPLTFIPKRRHIVVLVGPELKYAIKGEMPTMEEVDAVHTEYFASIRKMFDENAAEHGFGHYNLIFQEEREAEARLGDSQNISHSKL